MCQDGIWNHVVRHHGLEHLWCGEYDVNLIEHWSKAVEKSGNKLAENAKLISIVGKYIADKYKGRYYALAHNLRPELIQEYDKVLQNYDLLVMPTTLQKAHLLDNEKGLDWSISSALGNLQNTCAFDASGHPALNVPCGSIKDLSVGMMLVGKYFDEVTVLRAASAFEEATGKLHSLSQS